MTVSKEEARRRNRVRMAKNRQRPAYRENENARRRIDWITPERRALQNAREAARARAKRRALCG